MNRGIQFLSQILILLIFSGIGCKKETDYRDKYLGNYNFTTKEHYINPADTSMFDTTITYSGKVIKSSNITDQIQIYYLPNESCMTVTLNEDGTIYDNTYQPNVARFNGKFMSENQLNISILILPANTIYIYGLKTQ